MPAYGEKQQPAGVKIPAKPINNGLKTMRCGKGFKIQPQHYTAGPNAVLQANE